MKTAERRQGARASDGNQICSLSAEDYQGLLEMVEELDGIVRAMREILARKPIRARPLDETLAGLEPGPRLREWIDFISGRIRACREEAGFTQTELAEKSGLPQSHISRLEGGKHSPSRHTVEKIAAALGRPVSDFDPSEGTSD
jgi:DNA-binding XRE family transcriptional regulator